MNSTKVEQQRNKLRNQRIVVIGGFLTFLYLVVGVKLFYLQVIVNRELAALASDQYQTSMKSLGKRGIIFDANYRELALSTSAFEIGVHPEEVKREKEKQAVGKRKLAKEVAEVLKLDENFVHKQFTVNKKFAMLDNKVPPLRAENLKTLGIAGFEYDPSYLRVYPNKLLAAQLIGFVRTDGYGLDGLEYYYDNELQGDMRHWTVFKDRKGGVFDRKEVCTQENNGNNLILTIDSTIQYIAETALQKSVEENNAKSGLAIVMSPETGAVKAIAHYPTFNPNSFNRFPKETWRNRSVTDTFEPGSALKVFLIAAALESGLCDPETMINCENGVYRIGRSTIHDTHEYEFLTVHDVLKFSSNIGAVKIAEMIGPQTLYDSLRNFGFGEKTGINCPGEVRGMLRHYEGWKKIDNATISFGQGITVTPIQLITAISAVANHGVLMTPYVVQAVTDNTGNILRSFPPVEKRKVIMPETARALMRMMNAVTDTDGTGGQAVPVGYSVCGKTGTAQKINANGTYRNCEYNGVFVGFAPAQSPELAVLVVIDEPQKHHYGGVVAAPVFREIVHETFNYLNIPPSVTREQINVSNGVGEVGA
ncbi:MAG: penicillin-binding protein 2 [Desulfobacteraceae bacterium]|jgi:cell division protein FtsI (penicillin-binding protein 3)|nr:penicillin-binding protein 2 [Desulfobacteraceae bacterium]